MRTINEIIIHCTATEQGKDYTVQDITNWHKQRGFTTIGYHFVIHPDGKTEAGRDINLQGAHCKGHNANSIGVAYIGGLKNGKPADTRTTKQKNALMILLQSLCFTYNIRSIKGHCDYSNKDCPCFDAIEEYKKVCESIEE